MTTVVFEAVCVMGKKVFGAADASNLVKELRRSFDDGVTRGYEWRVTQLKKLLVICDNHEPEIVAALRDDLGKPELESSVYEVKQTTLFFSSSLYAFAFPSLLVFRMFRELIVIGQF